MKVAVLCGGPSLERGISLNSARSVLDHLGGCVEIVPIYIDIHLRAYQISKAQLYSNTPSDFDFKLHQAGHPLTESDFVSVLRSVDLVFPAMHGAYGEGGPLQAFLERHQIPFVGSPQRSCVRLFDKFESHLAIQELGFTSLPTRLIERKAFDQISELEAVVTDFFAQHQLSRAIVKPAIGGSSIGVFSVRSVAEAIEKIVYLWEEAQEERLVLEAFAQGSEFTVIILQNRFGLPVALPPTEIETDYTGNQIFDYRRKYLPSRQVTWHCPPRFSDEVIERIQAQAEQIFAYFGMCDFARFDGWVLPDGRIWFCDFNTISGMEQNSFLFQQAARIGFTHAEVLRHIVASACRRYQLKAPPALAVQPHDQRSPVHILFGGKTAERQVSLMSGTNVWLKLRDSERYRPIPHLLDMEGHIWQLPYHLALSHTVEEIAENCKNYPQAKQRLASFEARARIRLGLSSHPDSVEFGAPKCLSLNDFIDSAQFVFIALHGGFGENGELQAMLQARGVAFNGSTSTVAQLCMNKWATARRVRELGIEGLESIEHELLQTQDLLKMNPVQIEALWGRLSQDLNAQSLIVKPNSDGCSAGVVHLFSAEDLKRYVEILRLKATYVPKHTFAHQLEVIEMPLDVPEGVLCERYIGTDDLHVMGLDLKHEVKTGWVEVTVGVLSERGVLRALNPSITIAEGEVLSVEEKFQGGTGVNITPPPTSLVSAEHLNLVKSRIQEFARAIGISGYARIDAFVELKTGRVKIIEVNNLPGLTASTVLYHQALAEAPALFPREFLETIIRNAQLT